MYVEQFDGYLINVIRNEILVVPAIICESENWALIRRIATLWMKCLGHFTGCTLCDRCSI
jgi:hypothetical protein